ncbi:MAG: alanine racemase [Armatimonadetes bacterium]|nr:alanine racemase [Armatimonadota bacterium]
MNQVTIDLHALRRNMRTIGDWMDSHGASWTVVSKVLCGHHDTLHALHALGVRSVGDSRLMNLQVIREVMPDSEAWYLRLPHLSEIESVVTLSDVSLNSEIEVIKAINEESRRQGKTHRIIIMIELGDLREGILPGSLVKFYEQVFDLSNIDVLGIGANLGCLAGAVPNIDQLMQLALYRELLELKFNHRMPVISAGSSSVLPMLQDGVVPKSINHFRIGESLFLGTDLIRGGTLEGLRDDVVLVEAEIAEIKKKSLVPLCETTDDMSPFVSVVNEDISPGQRGYRALVTIGQLDTDVLGLTPVDPDFQIAGASSDITVVNLGDSAHGLEVGDTIKFRVSYSALLRLMNDKYIAKTPVPGVLQFVEEVAGGYDSNVPPTIVGLARFGSGGKETYQ